VVALLRRQQVQWRQSDLQVGQVRRMRQGLAAALPGCALLYMCCLLLHAITCSCLALTCAESLYMCYV
jgi:hypothetical protein